MLGVAVEFERQYGLAHVNRYEEDMDCELQKWERCASP